MIILLFSLLFINLRKFPISMIIQRSLKKKIQYFYCLAICLLKFKEPQPRARRLGTTVALIPCLIVLPGMVFNDRNAPISISGEQNKKKSISSYCDYIPHAVQKTFRFNDFQLFDRQGFSIFNYILYLYISFHLIPDVLIFIPLFLIFFRVLLFFRCNSYFTYS